MPRQILAAAAATLLLLTAAGCGRSDDEERAISSLAEQLQPSADEESDSLFGDEFANCFAEKLVDGAGLDQLVEDKVLTEDHEATEGFNELEKVSDKSADAFADAEYDCIDWDVVTTYLKDSDAVAATDTQVDDYVACMRDIDEDEWKAASKDQALGETDTEAISTFGESSQACQAKIAP